MERTREPIIIGAVQLPYYGRNSPSCKVGELEDYVLQNVSAFVSNGIGTLYIQDENLNPGPAYPETVAYLASLGKMLKMTFPKLRLGFVVQAHDAYAPIAAATACGADFVRIKVFAGSMLKAEGRRDGVGIEAVNYRNMLGSGVRIIADVYDREGVPMPIVPLEMAISWADRFGADAFVLTGRNWDQTFEYLGVAGKMGLSKPVLVGGSVREDNVCEVLDFCDGVVVSSSLMLDEPKEGSSLRWDAAKIRSFVKKVSLYEPGRRKVI